MMRTLLSLIVVTGLLCGGAARALPPERVLFDDSFDAPTRAGSPCVWQPLEGSWLLAQRMTRVLRQESEEITADSWNLAQWANYSVVTKCLGEEGEGPWGIGLTAYDDGQSGCYRLRLGEGRLYLEKIIGTEVRVLSDVEARSARGKWLSLRLSLSNSQAETVLSGKLWGSSEEEPKEWLISARDAREPYRGGSVGLWTGNCAGRFAFVSLKRYDPYDEKSGDPLYATDFSEASQGRLPAYWRNAGGLWVRDSQDRVPVLRQMIDQCGSMYNENAWARLEWTGYSVSAMAIAHPGNTKWGVGLVAYYGPGGSNYRLRTLDNKAYLVKRSAEGRLENLASFPLSLKRGVWYNLKLAVDNLNGAARLQAKVWEENASEPPWQQTAYDRNNPLPGGAPGLWCFGSAVDFDNFQVRTSTLSALNEWLP